MALELKEKLARLHSLPEVVGLGGLTGIATAVGSDLKRGLPAAAVERNRATFGGNRLADRAPRTFLSHLFEAFEDTTLKILVASAVVSTLFGVFLSDNSADVIQGAAIVIAVVVVSGVNSFQNWSKDREFKALAALKQDFRVTVVRDGEMAPVSVYDVVVGDVIKFWPGDRLPCDGLLMEGFNVEVNQSSMTGESMLVEKGVEEDPFMIGGCMVQQGEGTLLATAVGTSTKMGQTVALVENEEIGDTPLQEQLEELAGEIGKYGTLAGGITFAVLTALWFWSTAVDKQYTDLLRFFIVGVTIVVVAVPEGLPLAVTISLAFSMRRMMKDNNLVRQLQACETMGSATVIASDKTGTLTENRMSVVQAWAYGTLVDRPSALLATIKDPGALHRLAKAIALNSTAGLKVTREKVEFVGNPTEAALLMMLWTDCDVDYTRERAEAGKPLARRPFDKTAKYMSTLMPSERRGRDDGPLLYVKGAPETVLEMCTSIQHPSGDLHPITSEVRFNLHELVTSMARKGLRTLAVAYRRLTPAALSAAGVGKGTRDVASCLSTPAFSPPPGGAAGMEGDSPAAPAATGVESELTLLGVFGIADPLREGVTAALAKCVSAGIRVMMVTGDHRDTAAHIAQQCGILRPGMEVMEGPEFRSMSEEERADVCTRLAVLARSSPTDKYLLVKTLKDMGEVVAVTGDGTNDAPALRAADVGLSMGIAGTEVAKEASDIVIMDDRFSSIVAAVRWGRSIKENIRKFLTFQLTINMVALTLTFVTACANGGSTDGFPITPVQLLWVNLIMDSFAALALATEPPSERLMAHAPHGKSERLITRTMAKNIVGHAVFQTALLLWLTMTPSGPAFFGLSQVGTTHHHTIVFTTFVALQVFNLFNCRAVHDEWNVLADFSSSIIAQAIISIIVIMQVIIVQVGGNLTQTVPLTTQQWGLCVMLGFLSVPIGYVLKLVPVCERELRMLGPGRQSIPTGMLYGETASVRGALARALTETASSTSTPQSDLLQQTTSVATAVAAAADSLDDDRSDSVTSGGGGPGLRSGSGGGSGMGDTPRHRYSRTFRRDSRSSADSAGGGTEVDLDSLVADGTAKDAGSHATGHTSPGGGGQSLRLRSTRKKVLAALSSGGGADAEGASPARVTRAASPASSARHKAGSAIRAGGGGGR